MKFESEKELEELLFEAEEECLDDHNLCDDHRHRLQFRQFHLKGYGTIDILGVDYYYDSGGFYLTFTIYELKNGMINLDSIEQISRYFIGLKRYIRFTIPPVTKIRRHIRLDIKGILVGSEYGGSEDVCFLVDSIPWLSCYFFKISRDGVWFEESEGWVNKAEDKGWVNNEFKKESGIIVKEYIESRRNLRRFEKVSTRRR